MRILAIETSETAGSVAALIDDKAIGQLDLPRTLGSAKTLAQPFRPFLPRLVGGPPRSNSSRSPWVPGRSPVCESV